MQVMDSANIGRMETVALANRQVDRPVASFAKVPFHTVLHEAASEAAKTSSTRIHEVQEGEHLTGIIRRRLEGQGKPATNQAVMQLVRETAEANQLSNPDLIYPGQRLLLSSSQQAQAREQAPQEVLLPPTLNSASGTASAPLAKANSATLQDWMESRVKMTALQSTTRSMSDQSPVDGALSRASSEYGRIQDLTRLQAQGGAQIAAYPDLSRSPSVVRRAVNMYESVSDIVRRARRIMGETAPKNANASDAPWDDILDGAAYLTSGFGMRADPFTGLPAFHQGIDLAAPHGTSIKAFQGGKVTYSGWLPGYGKTVVVEHGDGHESIYAHCSSLYATKGDLAAQGTTLGAVGSTGRSTGNHLHFEVRRNGQAVNPIPFLRR